MLSGEAKTITFLDVEQELVCSVSDAKLNFYGWIPSLFDFYIYNSGAARDWLSVTS